MRYWWVNQNKTYKHELQGGFLWSPKAKKNGARNKFYDNMTEAAPGDVVFSFFRTRISAIGLVVGRASSAPKPDFGTAGSGWANEGWYVPVDYFEIDPAPRPKDHIALLRPYLPSKYSPLNYSGDGSQSVYLAEVPSPLAAELVKLIGPEYSQALDALKIGIAGIDLEADDGEAELLARTDIGSTSKQQLVLARRGQGLFRANVRLIERCCRVTGVADATHLIASHIKPWKDSTDEERINGSNGLLLAPHVDHLFDKGHISFSESGYLIVAPGTRTDVLSAWGIRPNTFCGTFSPVQLGFLNYHREMVFRGPQS